MRERGKTDLKDKKLIFLSPVHHIISFNLDYNHFSPNIQCKIILIFQIVKPARLMVDYQKIPKTGAVCGLF